MIRKCYIKELIFSFLQRLRYVLFVLFALIAIPKAILAKPIIFSYYWPVANVEVINNEITLNSFADFDLNSVTHIDLLPHAIHGNHEVREYWKRRGKRILSRIYPFKGYDKKLNLYAKLKTYDEIYGNFNRALEISDGISIDELIGSGKGKVSDEQRRILIKVLSEIRKKYPRKFISIWGSAKWDEENIVLLKSIYQHCNLFIPEIYLSEYYTKINDYSVIENVVKDLERQCPGILGKTIIGLGIYSKLDTEEDISFSNHIIKQLNYIFLNPLLSKLNGIAFYAPIYGKDRSFLLEIDSMIRKCYLPVHPLNSL